MVNPNGCQETTLTWRMNCEGQIIVPAQTEVPPQPPALTEEYIQFLAHTGMTTNNE